MSAVTTNPVTLLVVAKAPVPGLAKTRLMAAMSADDAASIAAAALLDTLRTVAATPAAHRVVAMTGDLDAAARSAEVRAELENFQVIEQRGEDFGQRLVHAHHDAYTGVPVVQIGMDTPQVRTEQLLAVATGLSDADCVLGPAVDGGWWVLGLRSADMVDPVGAVPMSTAETGANTRAALEAAGHTVALTETLLDADELGDLAAVAAACAPDCEFRAAVARVLAQPSR